MSLTSHAAVILLCLIASTAHAAATLDGFKPGTAVSGPPCDPTEFAGRVVLVEFWGVNCPPCRTSIPHLSALQAKYGRDRLLMVANHVQDAEAATVKATFTACGGSDQISVITFGSLAGANIAGIPHCFLFSHEGKLVYDGSPFDLDAPLAAAISASPGFLVAGRTFQKVRKQAAMIGALQGNLAAMLKSLRSLAADDDAVANEEATWLLNRVRTYSEQQLAKITAARTADTVLAAMTLARVVPLFAGDDLGAPFEFLTKELKADKDFQNRLKAAGLLAYVRTRATRIGLDTNPQDAKRNRQAMAQISEGVRTVLKKFPGTKPADEASALVTRWGL